MLNVREGRREINLCDFFVFELYESVSNPSTRVIHQWGYV